MLGLGGEVDNVAAADDEQDDDINRGEDGEEEEEDDDGMFKWICDSLRCGSRASRLPDAWCEGRH